MYYNIDRVLVHDNYTGQKWHSGVNCNLTQTASNAIVFDIANKVWRYQPLDKWNTYLLSIGNLKLSPTQKLDANDVILNKTIDEMYSDNTISYQEFKKLKTQKINSDFQTNCLEVGVAFEGNYFQYDDTSRARLLETKDDARVSFWRSVDNQNIPMTNEKKNELYELLKFTYYTRFAQKSLMIDSL